jgi:hypothetical protein
MSIHSWFRGQYVRDKNYQRIAKFIDKVNDALDKGILPAPDMSVAKEYLSAVRIDKV